MSKINFSLILIFLCSVSCEEDSPSPRQNPAGGDWFGPDNVYPSFSAFLPFIIRPDSAYNILNDTATICGHIAPKYYYDTTTTYEIEIKEYGFRIFEQEFLELANCDWIYYPIDSNQVFSFQETKVIKLRLDNIRKKTRYYYQPYFISNSGDLGVPQNCQYNWEGMSTCGVGYNPPDWGYFNYYTDKAKFAIDSLTSDGDSTIIWSHIYSPVILSWKIIYYFSDEPIVPQFHNCIPDMHQNLEPTFVSPRFLTHQADTIMIKEKIRVDQKYIRAEVQWWDRVNGSLNYLSDSVSIQN